MPFSFPPILLRVLPLVLWCFLPIVMSPWTSKVNAEESFPFLAAAADDHVNVRAGGNINFEQLCQLKKGEEVIVWGRDYEWVKIQLPSEALSFISGKYVRVLSAVEGEITAKGVNVRAREGINATILGQLEAGTKVRILEKKGEWYRIQPPANIYGWVSEQFLHFQSADISAYRAAESFLPSISTEAGLPIIEESQPPALQTQPSSDEGVSVTGVVEPLSNPAVFNAQYQLNVNGLPVYYLRGVKSVLSEFVHQKVMIEGNVDRQTPEKHLYPVLIVSKVQLVL